MSLLSLDYVDSPSFGLFETERLILRPLSMEDLNDLYLLYCRPELMQYITGRPRTFQETQERLLHHMVDHQQYGFGLCAAVDKVTGKTIGRRGMESVLGPDGMEGDIASIRVMQKVGMRWLKSTPCEVEYENRSENVKEEMGSSL